MIDKEVREMCRKDKRRIRRKMAFRREREVRRAMIDIGFPSDTTVTTSKFLKWASPRCKKGLKRISNRRVRRNHDVGSGSNYKKCFDLQWTLW